MLQSMESQRVGHDTAQRLCFEIKLNDFLLRTEPVFKIFLKLTQKERKSESFYVWDRVKAT